MNKKGLKIVGLLLVMILSIEFALPTNYANALSVGKGANNKELNWENPNKSGNNPYKLTFRNVVTSDMLMNVVGCTGIVNKVSKISTEFVQDLLKSKAKRTATKALRKVVSGVQKTAGGTLSITELVQAFTTPPYSLKGDPAEGVYTGIEKETEDQIKKLDKDEIISVLENSVSKQREANFTEKCLNGIATTLAKNQLTAMTKATMNWVQTGFNGDPLYVSNVNNLIGNLTDELVLQETNLFRGKCLNREQVPIKNKVTGTIVGYEDGKCISYQNDNILDYPYGRDFARSAIEARRIEKNFMPSMKQTLTDYLPEGTTVEDFTNDFGKGGWDGWLAMTQIPQNNPLGFTIKATEYLQSEKDKVAEQTKDEVNRGGGYRDQKVCEEWESVNDIAKRERERISNEINKDTLSDREKLVKAPNGTITGLQQQTNTSGTTNTTSTNTEPKCIKWKTVTPASTIKDKVSTYINSPERQLELAKTINDSLNALFTALLNKFQSQGLAGVAQSATRTTEQPFSSLSNVNTDTISAMLETGTTDTLDDGDPVRSIDITKDLGSIIQIQKDYITATKDYLKITNKVMPALGELDYCIPGPNPNWKINSDEITVYQTGIQESRLAKVKSSTYSNRWKSRKKNRAIRAEQDANAKQAVLDKMEEEDTILGARAKDYEAKVNALYGPKSPMQTPTYDNTNTNSSWLPMAQVGLNMTKDMGTTNESIVEETDLLNTEMASVNGYIYQLNKIKAKVDAIVKKAEKRDDEARKSEGLDPVSKACRSKQTIIKTDLEENIDTETGITDQMRATLSDLGYSEDQINGFSVDQIKAIISGVYGQNY